MNLQMLEPIYDEGMVPDYQLPQLREREETLALFAEHVYGTLPCNRLLAKMVMLEGATDALNGLAHRQQWKVTLGDGQKKAEFIILLYTPAKANAPVPLFLGLNFKGNHTVCKDPAILLPGSWCRNDDSYGVIDNRANECGRGKASSSWEVEMLLQKGYGLATVYHGDLAPDDPERVEEGILRFFPSSPSRANAISAWAWGLSRALDALEGVPEVDIRRVAVVGHSRLGKAALWAGANDERFGLVISNNSGCGGAALSRRRFGERLVHINGVFPHWFTEKFYSYNERESALPVDQHQLLALIAPRAVYVASAREDRWADPRGEYLALASAASAWGECLPMDTPNVDQPLFKGMLGYHVRSGGHRIQAYDWCQFVRFADRIWD